VSAINTVVCRLHDLSVALATDFLNVTHNIICKFSKLSLLVCSFAGTTVAFLTILKPFSRLLNQLPFTLSDTCTEFAVDKLNLTKHISSSFNEEIDEVRNHVMAMGGLIEQQLNNALMAIANADAELAQKVIDTDLKVNDWELQIDKECTRIIVRRQPAASDLRLIMAIMKTIADLERIGDETRRIARVALESFNSEQQGLLVNLDNLGRHVGQMLHDVLDAFARMDVETALLVHKEDKKVDREYEAITRQLMTYMIEDPRSIPKIMNVLWSARSLERIGDRCKNLAEYIIFFVKGKVVRHSSAEQLEQDARS
jgi:phosphate transport system protein